MVFIPHDDVNANYLPFRIRPAVLDGVPGLSVPALAEQVNFRGDAVRTTSTGRTVPERRLTAWEGDPAVAVPGFAYSGNAHWDVLPAGPRRTGRAGGKAGDQV